MSAQDTKPEITVDWTVNPNTGAFNSSQSYLSLVAAVKELLSSSGGTLIGNPKWAEQEARVIVSQLAHKHGMAPINVEVTSREDGVSGKLTGYFMWNGKLFRYEVVEVEPSELQK